MGEKLKFEKPIEMAAMDGEIFNDVIPPNLLPDLHIYLQGTSHPSCDPPSASISPADALSPSSTEELMQQLLSRVDTLSI